MDPGEAERHEDGGSHIGEPGVRRIGSAARCAICRCAAGLLRGNYPPLEAGLEVVEACFADPVVLIERAESFVKDLGPVLHRKLRPTKGAVVVVPLPVPGVSAIRATAQIYAFQKSLLTLEPPITPIR